MKRAHIIVAAKAAVSALLVAVVVRFLDVAEVMERLRSSDLGFVLLGYATVAAVITLSGWRWHILANGLLDWGQAMRYTWIGAFFGHILPGGVSGDIAKGVSIALKHPGTRDLTLPASIVVDKLVGFIVLVVLFAVACLSLFLSGQATESMRTAVAILLVVSVVGLGGMSLALWLVANGIADRLIRRLGLSSTGFGKLGHKVTESLRQYARAPALLWKAVGISVAIHLLNMALLYATLRAVGVQPPLLLPMVAYPMLAVAVMLPITVSGIGVREIMMIGCFAIFGLGREAAVAQAWLAILMSVPIVVLGALIQLGEVFGRRARAAPPQS